MQNVRENHQAREERLKMRFVILGVLCLLVICIPSKVFGQAGTVIVDTTDNTVDGDTRSVAYLLEDRGKDGKISFHEAIQAINNSPDDGYIVRFNLPYGSVISPPAVTLSASNTTINGDKVGDIDNIPDVSIEHYSRSWGLVITSDHNIIKNLAVEGIRLYGEGAHHNYIYNCYIGMDVSGSEGTEAIMHGVALHDGAHHNFILNNKIGGNINRPFNINDVMAGVFLRNAHENEILGNWIGLNAFGEPLANDVGIIIEWGSSKNIVGGIREDTSCNYPCNVLGNQKANAIIVRDVGSDENVIQGNYIGVAPDGITPMGNGTYNPPSEPTSPAVIIACGAQDNLFGGAREGVPCDGPCNVVSATESSGVHIFGPGTQRNRIQGNYIGLSIDGTLDLGNWAQGIVMDSTDDLDQCTPLSGLGGESFDESAFESVGAIVMQTADMTALDLSQSEGNTRPRAALEASLEFELRDNLIGDKRPGVDCTGSCNVISGNGREGILIYGADARENTIQGNYIGVTPSGASAMSNTYGIFMYGGAAENIIGGEKATAACDGPCNVISGNGFDGIALANVGTDGNQFQGNVIGMNPQVAQAIPNGRNGIRIWWSPADNLVGGPRLGGICREGCNVIAGNGKQGILIEGDERTRGNTIRGNAIFANGGLGIDLDKEGVTYYYEPDKFDVQDAMNFPLSVSAVYDPNTNSTTVSATLTIEEAEGAVVDFYANEERDPTGYGEGQWYLGEATSIGDGTFEITFEGKLEFHHVSATATNADGSTSEFGRRPALIFIPGVAGSTLADGFGKDKLWVGLPQWHHRLSLYPGDDYSLDIYATDAIRTAYGLPFYQPTFDRLTEDGGYVEYPVEEMELRRTTAGCYFIQSQIDRHPDLFIFAYDWRHGVQTHTDEVQGLRDYIGCIQTFYPGSKVDILAHSMGGLLARRYILDYPEDHQVNKLITAATPYLGAPKAIYVLETGDWAGFVVSLVAWPTELRYVMGSFPGAHQLLPTKRYYNLEGKSLILGGAWDSDDNSNPGVTYDYDSYKRILDERYGQDIFAPITISENFRNHPGQEDWSGDNSGVDYFILYGIMDEGDDKTVGQVEARHRFVCKQTHPLVMCTPKKVLHIRKHFIAGDETVPEISAIPLGIESVNARIVPFYGSTSGGDEEIIHGDFTSNVYVLDSILGILTHGWDLHSGDAQGVQAMRTGLAARQDRYYVTILGGEEFDIPQDGDHFLLGDRADLILLPTSGTYTLSFLTTDEPLAIEITRGTNTTATLAIRYIDLSLPSGVEAKLVFSDQGVDDLMYDEDGDGNFESVVLPTISVSGPEADDLEPPVIEVTVANQGETLLVTLEAVDVGSGVRSLYYSLDGENYEPYTSALVIDPEQTPLLYAFADDHVWNRASLIYPSEPSVAAAMDVDPRSINFQGMPGSSQQSSFNVVETGGGADIQSVSMFASDLNDNQGNTIPGGSVSFDPASFDVTAGGSQAVIVTVAIPGVLPDGIYEGKITVESLNAGSKEVHLSVEVISNAPPIADANGPYEGEEGIPVILDASGSSDPDDNIVLYEWDLDDDGDFDDATGVTTEVTFNDNGTYTVGLRVTDEYSESDSDTAEVMVLNVHPIVEAGRDRMISEGETLDLDPATFTDPGILDTHIATIDWGDGSSEEGDVSESDGSGAVSGSHVYGDNGTFTVTITVCDDEGDCGSDPFMVEVNNLSPTLTLDIAGVKHFADGDAFLGRLGVPQTHEATAIDPGSDDLIFEWGFGVSHTYFNDGVGPDPFPSTEGEFPFQVTDSSDVTFDTPGIQAITIEVLDDDGGFVSEGFQKIITGDEDWIHSRIFWLKQFSGRGRPQMDEDTLLAYLDIVNFASWIFSEKVQVNTIEEAQQVLKMRHHGIPGLIQAYLLTAWLNFASGAIDWDQPIYTHWKCGGGTTFHELLYQVETLWLMRSVMRFDFALLRGFILLKNLESGRMPGFCR